MVKLPPAHPKVKLYKVIELGPWNSFPRRPKISKSA